MATKNSQNKKKKEIRKIANKNELLNAIRNIADVKLPQELLDLAFSRARKKKKKLDKINTVRDIMYDRLSRIYKTFPTIEALPEFYRQLLDNRIGITKIKKSLASIKGAVSIIQKITKDKKELSKDIKHIYGRISSIVKKLEKELLIIRKAKKELNELPIIDPELFTVAVTGLPNVGKTTTLNLLSGTSAEVADYAFTTKHINVGILKENLTSVQLLDTPGVLGRAKKNTIEEEAYIAMKFASHLILFVYDPLQQQDEQKKIFNDVKKLQKPLAIYISKLDLVPEEKRDEILHNLKTEFKAPPHEDIPFFDNLNSIKSFLLEQAKRHYKDIMIQNQQ